MAIAARLPLAVRRYQVARFTIRIAGIDLSARDLAMEVRLRADTPGVPLVRLDKVTTAAAEGIKVEIVTENGLPVSYLKGRFNKTTMSNAAMLPYSGDIGGPTILAYGIVIADGAGTLASGVDATERFYGDFIVEASAFGSNGAPTNQSAGYGGYQASVSGSGAASMTFGDQIVDVTIDGADLLAPIVLQATDAAAAAEGFADEAGTQAGIATAAAEAALNADISASRARALAVQIDLARVTSYSRNYARQFATTTVLSAGVTIAHPTITIPPGGAVTATPAHPTFKSDNQGGSGYTGTRYFAVYQTNPSVAGLTPTLDNNFGPVGNTPIGTPFTQGVSGLWKATVEGALPANTSGIRFTIKNNGTAPITILVPFAGLSPYVLHNDREVTAVRNRPESEPAFGFNPLRAIDRQRRQLAATVTVDAATGNDTAAGGPFTPVKTLAKAAAVIGNADNPVIAMRRGGKTRETSPIGRAPSGLGGTDNLQPQIIDNDLRGFGKPLHEFTGLDMIANNAFTSAGSGTYNTAALPGTTGNAPKNNGYSNVFLVEIDTTLEATRPWEAQRRMTGPLADAAAVIATPGGYRIVSNSGDNWVLHLHPTDGAAPGTRYRYEWSARFDVISLYQGKSGDGAVMEGVAMTGASSGAGSLNAGHNFLGDRLLLAHGATHLAVVMSGSITNSVFYGRGDGDCIQLVFYIENATGGEVWKLENSFFLDGGYDGFYSHTSSGSYLYGSASYNGIAGSGSRAAGYYGTGWSCSNQTVVQFVGNFVTRQTTAFAPGCDVAGTVEDGIAWECVTGATTTGGTGQLTFRNSIFHCSGYVPNPGQPTSPETPRGTSFSNVYGPAPIVENCLFHVEANVGGIFPAASQAIRGWGGGTHRRCILILEQSASGATTQYIDAPSAGTAGNPAIGNNYNLTFYDGHWGDLGANYPNQPNQPKYDDYLATGQDAHSLLMTADGDPNFLDNLFVDRASGNYAFRPTAIGRIASEYMFANDAGPRRLIGRRPTVPTIDELATGQRLLG